MPETKYLDLAEFSLPFITAQDREFPELLHEIQSRPQPFATQSIDDRTPAAVLLNRSEKAIIVLAHVWRYTTTNGQTRTSRHSNLGSSMQMDILAGRTGVTRDRASFILPNSKRLITEAGVFGDNSDVMPPESDAREGGLVHGGVGGGPKRWRTGEEEVTRTELHLDVVLFEDGLCVGPTSLGCLRA